MTPEQQIVKLLGEYPATARAHRWHQTKGDGKTRPITTPNDELKKWQQDMNKALVRQFNDWPDYMHGGIKKRSYVTYARPHIGKDCVITIDVKQCFDSISENHVREALVRHLGLPPDVCRKLAKRLCFKGWLAQGYPTSNYLCNLYLLEPLGKLHRSLETRHLTLGNYVDDIAVSGKIAKPDEVINEAAIALSQAHLKMSKAKVRVMPASGRQLICGILVNKKLSLTKEVKLRIFRDITNGEMSEASIRGWLAQLKSIDPHFGEKLRDFAVKRLSGSATTSPQDVDLVE
jgi:hypothetical protein